MSHEQKVREFYDSAVHCYESIMGHTWHHADPEAEARGLSVLEAAQVLEEKVVSHSGLRSGDRALDFGSGVGGPTVYMAGISSASFVGLSNNEELSRRARDLAKQLGLTDRVSFLTTGDEDYKTLVAFADASFDAVIFCESVCHLPDKAAFFRAAFRILKPGARLVGIDWLQRSFGEHRTDDQILRFMRPVNEHIRIPGHGSITSYQAMMAAAGFQVTMARDLFEGVQCWGSTPKEERPRWLNYDGPEAELFRKGKAALDAARESGVFTVGMFVAVKPG
ncbi:MAG: SAM-dependent methyltransferase [Pseudonocardiaceae bacterium]